METAKRSPLSGSSMAMGSRGRPGLILLRDLLVATVLGGVLFALFGVFNARLLRGFSAPEVLLLEAGAIVLVAFLVARAVTNATNSFLEHHGLRARGHAVRLFLNLLIAIGTVFALFRLAGVSAESVLLGAGFTGIVLGLASQTVLSNVFAGVLIVFADPFRPGDRVGFITWQFGILPGSYPHEAVLPTYSGTVEDVGLTYTTITLDTGGVAKLPNGIVIQALVVLPRGATVQRVRLTFPLSVSLASVEAAVPALAATLPPPFEGAPPPRLEVAEVGATSWDAVVVLWTDTRDPGGIRDRVLRVLLRSGSASRPS
ncbi:MAG TPA: mechanosensitive ion channel family protein [Thermoplasmata archaeon]|nr:mechanosensitive ion channel family protein [Thermoplasmata archaeon]